MSRPCDGLKKALDFRVKGLLFCLTVITNRCTWDEIRSGVEEWIDNAVKDINSNPVWSKKTKAKVDRRKASLVCPYGSGRSFRSSDALRSWMDDSRNYWRPEMKAGRDYVECLECNGRFQKLTEHLRKSHEMSRSDYLGVHPDSSMIASVLSKSVSQSCSDNPRRQKGPC